MSLEPLFDWLSSHQGLDLDQDQRRQFEEFQDHLYESNRVMNLTRIPIEECWIRHFADSLLFHDRFGKDSKILDIGSGPGFPSWPLACARPDLRVTALDSNGKMTGFLSENLLPNLTVIEGRAEELKKREVFDVVTGRAVAPLPLQLELSVAACKVGGKLMPMRTPQDNLDLADLSVLGLKLVEIETRRLPGLEVDRLLPTYLKLKPTEKRFPRRWQEMKTNPLR